MLNMHLNDTHITTKLKIIKKYFNRSIYLICQRQNTEMSLKTKRKKRIISTLRVMAFNRALVIKFELIR